MEERIQKILANAGYGSRRSCEGLISGGRVTVNGQVAHLGSKADIQKDQIKLDGKLIKLPESFQYIALYKPRGVVSAVSTPDPRPTVRDLVPVQGTLYPVGRLDVDSEGLILLTNDGELANQLTHPRYGHEKEYRVLVARHPDEKQLIAWRHGVVMEDGYRTAPAQVEIVIHSGKGTWVRVIMKEGRKRQIRDTCHLIGLPVVNIIRVRIGSLRLGNLKSSQWRYLTPEEVIGLKTGNKASSASKPTSAIRRGSPNKRSKISK
jgi:23S rRNA pseudouridine2605 synthase